MVAAHMGSRRRGAVLSKRIQRIAYTSDIAGDNYHFWGFFLRSLYGEGLKYRIMSFVHERIIQGDASDWLVDSMACYLPLSGVLSLMVFEVRLSKRAQRDLEKVLQHVVDKLLALGHRCWAVWIAGSSQGAWLS